MADINFPEQAVGGLLGWAYGFSSRWDDEKQIEFRMAILEFVSLGFAPKAPPFSIEDAAAGKTDPKRVSLAMLVSAYRYFKERKDPQGITVAQVLWHFVGVLKIQNLN